MTNYNVKTKASKNSKKSTNFRNENTRKGRFKGNLSFLRWVTHVHVLINSFKHALASKGPLHNAPLLFEILE